MTPHYKNKRDLNEAKIIEIWCGLGYTWLQMKPGQGFDGLLVTPQGMYIVEIKNPDEYWELTDSEKKLAESIEIMGQTYHIIESTEDALKLIGAKST